MGSLVESPDPVGQVWASRMAAERIVTGKHPRTVADFFEGRWLAAPGPTRSFKGDGRISFVVSFPWKWSEGSADRP